MLEAHCRTGRAPARHFGDHLRAVTPGEISPGVLGLIPLVSRRPKCENHGRGFLMKKTRACSARISLGTSLVCIASLSLSGLAVEDLRADATYVYAVQTSAQVQPTPPQITLNWEPDPYGATNYVVFRKAKDDTQWGQPVAVLPGYSSSYTDTTASQGSAYEYQVTKAGILGYTGYGYIYSGIEVPA